MTKAQRTKQLIIEQAAPLFNERGVAGTSIDDVLHSAKVAKGCLYGHFENKESLSHEIANYLLQKTSDNTMSALAATSSAKGKLLVFLDLNKDPLDPLIAGGCPILNFGVESDDTSPVIQQKVRSVIQQSLVTFSDIIRKGIADKEFAETFDADEFALKMFTLIEGGIMVCRVLNSNEQMQTIVDMLSREIESYELS